jgi:hypothetical protein
MRSSPIGWKKSAVWVCTKCFKETTIAEDIKTEFKMRLREEGLGGSIRVMTSSCLGICPEGQQAVYIQPEQVLGEAFECDPQTEKEKLFETIKNKCVVKP